MSTARDQQHSLTPAYAPGPEALALARVWRRLLYWQSRARKAEALLRRKEAPT